MRPPASTIAQPTGSSSKKRWNRCSTPASVAASSEPRVRWLARSVASCFWRVASAMRQTAQPTCPPKGRTEISSQPPPAAASRSSSSRNRRPSVAAEATSASVCSPPRKRRPSRGTRRSSPSPIKVPIVENPPVARTLYATVELDEVIPPENYKVVAEIISFVFKMKRKALPR
ncbi:MAG: hypothetical protein FJX60_06180 [Alphaproteobacteria bacterium]|nr:hypothetical protein [Alphaproteobacteria bacterium]